MGRPKEVVDKDLVERARRELDRLPEAKVAVRLQAIVSCAEFSMNTVASVFGVSRRAVWQWARKFRDGGLEALRDHRGGRRPRKLSSEQLAAVERWLAEGRNERGEPVHWTLAKLQADISELFGVRMGISALWKRVRALGFRQKVPRPRHRQADQEQQEAYKKNR